MISDEENLIITSTDKSVKVFYKYNYKQLR
jgi:hypothetical protein